MATLGFAPLAAVAVLVLLGLSAFFSSAEIAVFSLPPDWATDRVAAGDGRAAVLADLLADPHRLLVTILVGNNLVNIAISSLVTVVLVAHLPRGAAVTAATLLATAIILVFGEIVPKSYGLGHAREWALTVARPVAAVERLLGPVVTAFDALTRALSDALGGEEDIERPYAE